MTNRTSAQDVLDPARQREDALVGYDVLGDAPQRELQALVDIAAQVCAVPRAAINIITSTQQQQIATTGFAASICAREDSMCAAVLDHTDRVVVPDASLDARFRENPFVTGILGTVRFYASAPLTTPDGVIIGRLCVFDPQPRELVEAQEEALVAIAERVVDVLELRLRTRELEDSLAALTQTRDELHRSNEALSVFAGQVSHDLRTPLTAIMASTEMLGQQPAVAGDVLVGASRRHGPPFGDPDGRDDRADPRPRQGRRRAAPDRHGPGRRARLGARGPRPDPRSAGRRASSAGELPTLPADGQQLYSVLLNLVSNAVKYARPGVPPVIEVSAERSGESWRFSVRDNGIGISAGDRDLVFGLFNRVETSVDGSGIGLATVKRIIEAHGGTIGISSVEGPGTNVWFELPAVVRGHDEPDGSSEARRFAELA